MMPGPHGGNLDDPNVTIGTTVYLPVFVSGAKFALGDVHAAQADGEGVSPIDINALVTLRMERLCKDRSIPEPRLETDDMWVIDKEADTMEEAAEKAAVAMAGFLKERLQLSDHMIGIILSSVGGFCISQGGSYNYPAIVRAEVPKCIDRKGRLYGWK
jgi:amidase